MKKLTKEQADWLIEKFKPANYCANYTNNEQALFVGNIEKILGKCIEKEFPEFEIQMRRPVSHPLGMFRLSKFMENVQIEAPSRVFIMNIEEPQRFADACNKIVEYVNDRKTE